MPSKKELLAVLPPFNNDGILVKKFQSEKDIQGAVIRAHYLFAPDYLFISRFFWTGDIYTTCKGIWDFLKYNLPYTKEGKHEQSLKSPARILAAGEKIDCKNYSVFAGGVLDAIHEQYDSGFSWCYRFAGYKERRTEHVFVVVDPDTDDEIWIDPVLNYFDVHDEPLFYVDSETMALYILNGVDKPKAGTLIEVDGDTAIADFLTAVKYNLNGYKDLLRRNPDIVNTKLKAYFSPVDFSILINSING